jgi:hypothetical protein
MDTKIILSSTWIVVTLISLYALIFLLYNLVGLPTYPSKYDKFLLAVSLIFNSVTV